VTQFETAFSKGMGEGPLKKEQFRHKRWEGNYNLDTTDYF
jgi:hypothetical protein